MAISYSTVSGTGWHSGHAGNDTLALAGLAATNMDVDGNYVLGILSIRNATLDTAAVTMEDIVETAIVDASDGTRSTGISGGFQDGTPSDGAITLDYAGRSSTATQKTGMIFAFTGVDTSTPVAATGTPNTGTGTTITFPDTASVSSGDLILRICSWEGTGASTPSISAFTGVAATKLPNSGTNTGIALAAVSSSGGAPGTATATLSASESWIAFTVVLKAASSTSVAPLAAAYYYNR
jgi:hypothetical protein